MNPLKRLREDKEVSQQEIADYLGVTRQSYSNYEIGKRSLDSDTLNKLSLYFHVPVSFLISSQPFENWELIEKYSTEILVALSKTVNLVELMQKLSVSLDGKPLNKFVMLLDSFVKSIEIDESGDKISIIDFVGEITTEKISKLRKELITSEHKNKPVTERDRLREENNELFDQLPKDKQHEALNYLRFLVEHQEKE